MCPTLFFINHEHFNVSILTILQVNRNVTLLINIMLVDIKCFSDQYRSVVSVNNKKPI